MRVHAEFQEDGTIVALAEIIEEGDDRIGIRLHPSDGRKVAEFVVPPEYVDKPFSELVAQYRVREVPDGTPQLVQTS
ncbi:hypothetical protein [Streptomyces sp. NPDC017890]|uniref:hypothetical protein n=1 Tax=Streptomyces sp. NPDC017890 TaxID=3365015 RepID=UPI0037900FA7